MKKLLQLSFIPRSTDLALLALRLWFGLTLLLNHGIGKLTHFSAMSGHLPDPLGLGGNANMVLVLLAEVLCAACITIGIATRFAAAILVVYFAIIFTLVHHTTLASGPGSGELAFLYLGAALTILIAGGGRFVVCTITNDVSRSS